MKKKIDNLCLSSFPNIKNTVNTVNTANTANTIKN